MGAGSAAERAWLTGARTFTCSGQSPQVTRRLRTGDDVRHVFERGHVCSVVLHFSRLTGTSKAGMRARSAGWSSTFFAQMQRLPVCVLGGPNTWPISTVSPELRVCVAGIHLRMQNEGVRCGGPPRRRSERSVRQTSRRHQIDGAT
jgi:hypothetical protein